MIIIVKQKKSRFVCKSNYTDITFAVTLFSVIQKPK